MHWCLEERKTKDKYLKVAREVLGHYQDIMRLGRTVPAGAAILANAMFGVKLPVLRARRTLLKPKQKKHTGKVSNK